MNVNIALLTVTDTRTLKTDKSGNILVDKIGKANHNLVDRKICKDSKKEIKKILKDWIKKGFEEGQKDNTMVVMLIPARTDTKYWHDYVMKADEIRFVRGRIKFGDETNSAPFPSAVVVFRQSSFNGPRITGLERP